MPTSSRDGVIDVGSTHVTLNRLGSVVSAAILEKRLGPDGTVDSILLDRVIHNPHQIYLYWQASGCFVTELTPK
jgi:hypothetical protein